MSTRTTKGNVFLDLEFSPEKANELLLRSDLLDSLQKCIKKYNRSAKEVADLLHINEETVINILKGRIDLFDSDFLTNLLQQIKNL